MNKMLDAGVRVFKIEGRARGPEYVRTVVECYKEAIKAYLEDTFTDEKIAAWDERLKTVSTVVSGTATISDSVWENGPAIMDRRQRNVRFTWEKGSNTSLTSESPSFWLKLPRLA